MRHTILPALAFFIAAVACQPTSTELTDAQRTAIADTVRQVNADSWAAWQESGEPYLDYVSDWSIAPVVGFASMEEYVSSIRDLWAGLSRWDAELGETRVLVLGRDGAVLEGTAASMVTDTSGNTQEWTTQAGDWKVLLTRFDNQVRDVQ
jgi:hypothetical protein